MTGQDSSSAKTGQFPPLDTSWLFSELFFQGGTLPSDRLSNGIVLRIGGGL